MQNNKIILELEKEFRERKIEMAKQYCAESNINFYKLTDEDLLAIYDFLKNRAEREENKNERK